MPIISTASPPRRSSASSEQFSSEPRPRPRPRIDACAVLQPTDKAEVLPLPRSTVAAAPMGEPVRKKKRKARKQPTGDYEVGYCKPPVQTRFDGSKPGPGRKRGSVSQDTILRKHLDKKRTVRMDGRAQELSVRELMVILQVKRAVEEKNDKALQQLMATAFRLYPEAPSDTADAAGAPLSEADLLTLAEFEEDIRRKVLTGSGAPDPGTER